MPMLLNCKLISFVTSDNIILHGFIARKGRPEACAIYVHGMNGNFYSGKMIEGLAKAFVGSGMGFLSINTRGHDAASMLSMAKGAKKWQMGGTDLERFEDSVLDIDGAIKAAKTMGFRRFVLIGHSTGCQKATYFQYRKKSGNVAALILLAPADDYGLQAKRHGKRFSATVKQCRRYLRTRRGNEIGGKSTSFFSPRRFLSVADLAYAEARLFNYNGPLSEFGSIKTPICALFGSKEEYALMPVGKYISILEKRSSSRLFAGRVINGAGHSFEGYEAETASSVVKFARRALDL